MNKAELIVNSPEAKPETQTKEEQELHAKNLVQTVNNPGASRAERRRAQKELSKKTKRYNLTEQQIEARVRVLVEIELEKQMERVMNETIENTLAATIHVLNESFGLGTVRVKRFVGEYNATFDKVLAGDLNLTLLRQDAARFGVHIQGGK